MPQLCTLSFTSKTPTLCQSQEIRRWTDTSLLFASEGSPLRRGFSEYQFSWLYRGLAPLGRIEGFQRAILFLWLHLTVIHPGFMTRRVIFPLWLCPFQNNITFFLTDNTYDNIHISHVNFYAVDLTDCSTHPKYLLAFQREKILPTFRLIDRTHPGLAIPCLLPIYLQGPWIAMLHFIWEAGAPEIISQS